MTLPLFMQGNAIGSYLSEDRNLILNGDMFIDQTNEGASVSLTSGTPAYIVDGWKVSLTQASAVVTAQQIADAPPGFINSLIVTVATGATVGAGDSLLIQQPIEGNLMRFMGYGGAFAGTASLSFWVKSSLANGTYGFALSNSAGNRVYVGTFGLINNGGYWTQVVIPNIPGDVTGTWLTNNGIGLLLTITGACGSTNQTSTVNAWQAGLYYGSTSQATALLSTNGATFQITGVQFEPGVACTPYALKQYPAQLFNCRRYYRKSFPAGTAVAQNAGVTGCVTIKNPIALGDPAEWIPFDPPMRATPTITTFNPSASNANWRDITASADVTVSVDPATTKSAGGVLLATSGTVSTLGDILGIHYTANARL